MARATLGLRVSVTLAQTTRFSASRGKTTELAVLHDRFADPVGLGVSPNSLRTKLFFLTTHTRATETSSDENIPYLVGRVNTDYFKILVC